MPILRKEFPDLGWLKKEIAGGFSNRKGWPNVIINTKVTEAFRPGIKGPLSLFYNIHGISECRVGSGNAIVQDGSYFLSNDGEVYNLEIQKQVETFNIHFGESFAEEILRAHSVPVVKLLDEPVFIKKDSIGFFSGLYSNDKGLQNLIDELYKLINSGYYSDLLIEERLADLLIHLLGKQKNIIAQVESLPAAKRSTQVELYKRLFIAKDYMESYYNREISLEELSKVSTLSKYHFLRLFKFAFSLTPHQYLMQLRIDKAQILLKKSLSPVTEIAFETGFDTVSSFSRLFSNKTGYSPQKFREITSR